MPSDTTDITPRCWDDLPRRAWVTGAGKGIGRALVKRLVSEGWTVFASARTEDDLISLAAETETMIGKVCPLPLDTTDEAACTKAVDAIMVEEEPIGLVVLNAGTHTETPINDFDLKVVHKIFDVNVGGTVNCLAPAMQVLRAQGFGKIAVTASVAGYKGLPKAAAYCGSKAGVIAMCEALYPELRRVGVSLTVINPGFVKTPLTDKNSFDMPFLMEVDAAVDAIAKGLARDTFEIAFPTRFVLILKTLRLLPDWLYFKLTGKLLD